MHSQQIDLIISKLAQVLDQEINQLDLADEHALYLSYSKDDLGKYMDDLIEKGERINLAMLKNHIAQEQMPYFMENASAPLLVFLKREEGFETILIHKDARQKNLYFCFERDSYIDIEDTNSFINNLITYDTNADVNIQGEIILISVFPLQYIANDYYKDDGLFKKMTPLRRLFRLLYNERKDISYIYIYAIVIGLISLTLPLGIQATISMISGGMIFSSVIVLIFLVIIGILVGGALSITQITLVEIIQQRIFAKAAFELSFRITKIRAEALQKFYPPELMNRFFDVVTIQKSLPKIFVDILGAAIQILFGLTLMSLYHPFFLIFSLFLVTVIISIFWVSGPKGLKTSIIESKYKYKIAYWLEELARTIFAFKQAGHTNLPLQKMDRLVNNYLHYRQAHFKVLISQFISIVVFRTLVTGGLLIIGTILVVERQITLGQFVASEVIIILIVNSVEKLVINMDTIYDLLTGLDKVATITDLPIERKEGVKPRLDEYKDGLLIHTKDLCYKYPGATDYTLNGIDVEITPGENICIVGPNDSGKHTLVKVLIGTLSDYEGVITINHFSLRDLHLTSVRDVINKHLTFDEIFDGTILENITMGRTYTTYQDVIWAIENVGLNDYISSLEDGLMTHIGASGKKLSGGVEAKLLLARSVAARPKMLIVNDFSEHISKQEKLKVLSFLQEKSNGWTLIILSVSDDPLLLSSCDRILLMQQGRIAAQGDYKTLLKDDNFQEIMIKEC